MTPADDSSPPSPLSCGPRSHGSASTVGQAGATLTPSSTTNAYQQQQQSAQASATPPGPHTGVPPQYPPQGAPPPGLPYGYGYPYAPYQGNQAAYFYPQTGVSQPSLPHSLAYLPSIDRQPTDSPPPSLRSCPSPIISSRSPATARATGSAAAWATPTPPTLADRTCTARWTSAPHSPDPSTTVRRA